MPRPHPRPEPKGQHGESSPEHLYSAWFCCDAGAIQADAFYFFVWRCFPIANTGHQTNEEIRDKEVRLISESGEQLGIMSSQEALRMAEEQGLDLVKISPNAVPPVCKLMDYGKFRYQEQKKAQEAKAKQKVVQIKEVKFRPATDENDFQTKLRSLKRFLEDGDKAKITLRFRGREMAHQQFGTQLMDRVREELVDIAQVEHAPKLEGRQMLMFLAPAKDK